VTPKKYPPGPTWASESKRPLKELYEEVSRGILPHVRARFRRFGDIYYVTNQGNPMYVTRHPDHLHEVLVTKASSFLKRSKDVNVFLGNGLLTSDGELWRKQRRLIQPAFQRQNIARYAEVMVEHTERLLSRWNAGDVRDVNRDMMELTLSVVCKTLLDHDTHGDNDAVAQAMAVLQNTAGHLDLFPRWFPSPLHVRQWRAVKALDNIIFPMIDRRTPENRGEDLISQLKFGASGSGSDEDGMERRQLRDELVTLFLAGHETTALSMTWAFFLLAQNPAEEAKLHGEVDRVLGARPPRFEDLDALVHTRLIVQESMRLFPPLYLLPRVAREDTEVAGYEIPAGSEFLCWVYFVHRDDRWFPRATEFRPERFLPDSDEIKHQHAYYPFGAGPRACIGRHFAMVEAQLILAAIAQRFRLRLVPGQDVKLNTRVTLGPMAPIRMTIEARAR
jgi:cytochrome P450